MKNLKPSKRSLTYHGNSDRTKRRKRKSIHEAIKANGQTLDKFFILNKSDDEREEGNGDDEREGNGDDEKEKGSDKSNNQLLDEYILKIENKLKTDKKITPGQKVRYKAVQYFFQLQKSGHRKLESARIITQLLNRGEWFSKCVQTWTKSYALYNNIPQIGRSKYPGKSLIDDEDIWLKISSYLRKVKHNVTIQSFCDYVSSEILPFLEIETKITIRYQNLMPTFEGNNLERRIDLTLDENKKLYILATHDETTFQSNDGLKSGWMPNEEQPLRKKDTIGRLKLNNDQIKEVGNSNMYHKARVMINPVNQAIPIFEKTYPGAIAVFAFDNSSSHGKYADNELNANHMNLNPGEKQAKLRDTIFNGQIQHMNFPDNYHDKNLRRKPKGMKIILEKRGLWLSTGLKAYCGNNEYNVNSQCCARHILSNQPDFFDIKLLIQEIIEAKGHKVIFYPKFYCKLNYIEMYWGAAKWYAHQQCDYSWTGLQRVVPLALDSVLINHIRKYARKSA
ncbi:1511_t:CDS:2 [Rhizophagus irregularis]|nr:1511_t:CDS:2 [Rhizophagus irregularis]